MSELKAYYGDVYIPVYGSIADAQVYLKSDADKVITRHKYKRCMDKAQWCEATALWCYQAANTLPAGFRATLHGNPVMIEPDRLYKRYIRLTKWENRWLELAKKFK